MIWGEYGVGEIVAKEAWRAGGRFSAESAFDSLKSGAHQLWLVLENDKNIKAVLITDIGEYPDGPKICSINFVAGKEPRSWIPLIHVLKTWAKENGCTKIEAWSRRGWRRLLPEWKCPLVLLELELTDETEEEN